MTIARDKITEIFCMANDFCHIYDRFIKINGLAPKRDKSKRKYHRDSTLSDAEVTTIMILFHLMGYKCLKHFYLNEVYKNMTDLFPHTVSYNRFVELERKVAVPFILFVKKCCLGGCTGISFVDSTALRVCKNQRISTGFSRDLPSGASARWDGSMVSNCTSFATKRETS